jgi:hypothetical protein
MATLMIELQGHCGAYISIMDALRLNGAANSEKSRDATEKAADSHPESSIFKLPASTGHSS